MAVASREISADEIVLRPVGIVHRRSTDDEVRYDESSEAELEVYPEFEPALEGIDGFSHLFVIGYFHRLRPEQIGPLTVRPKGLVRKGLPLEELPLLGVFALDSPTRPNPIGLTLVKVRRREGRRIFLTGLDLFDGTPVLDIKGYRPQYAAEKFTLPKWHNELWKKIERLEQKRDTG